jgi:GH25 family lysozyme M1 (1,4-beta-N-acetylmuramidase)
VYFIDLSNNNGHPAPILDAAKRDGAVGCVFKISEGGTFTDSTAKAGIAHARHIGLKPGGYHFARFTSVADARAEAAHFVHAAHAAGLWHKGDFRPFLDYEAGSTDHASPMRDAFYAEVKRLAHGAHTILYTGAFFNPQWLVHGRAGSLDRRLWVPAYRPGPPGVPKGYARSDIQFHQFTDQHRLGGGFHVDASHVLGKDPAATLRRNCVTRAA